MRETVEQVDHPQPSGARPSGRGGRRARWAVVGAGAALVVALIVVALVLALVRSGSSGGGSGGDQGGGGARRSGQLTWAPPQLDQPKEIRLSARDSDTSLKLSQDQDYRIVLPAGEPLVAARGLSVYGGHDVVLVGGRIEAQKRALYFKDQTGTLHVEGVSLGGDGLKEGINLDERDGATVQLQNIQVDHVQGSRKGHHADLLQVWAGPERLRIDGFSGTTGYQGMFLLPHQFGDVEPQEWDFRRVAIRGDQDSAYLMWTDKQAPWLRTSDVVVQPPAKAADKERTKLLKGALDGVEIGRADSVLLPAGEPGVGYRSPGYASGQS